MDWSKYFDVFGIGWHYDKLSGLGVSDFDDPDVDNDHPHANPDPSCWFGATCVPADFATKAAEMWPDRVELLDEASWEKFYDDRAHVKEPTEHLDTDVLQGIAARVALEQAPNEHAPTTAPSAAILAARAKCLDPACQTHPGIRKNLNRRWADHKAARGITIHPDRAKPAE